MAEKVIAPNKVEHFSITISQSAMTGQNLPHCPPHTNEEVGRHVRHALKTFNRVYTNVLIGLCPCKHYLVLIEKNNS